MFLRHRGLCRFLPVILFTGWLLPGVCRSPQAFAQCEAGNPARQLDIADTAITDSLEQELLALTNQQRIGQGLQPLTPDPALMNLAREHSRGMAQQGFISHDQPSGSLKTRMSRAGYAYEVARENVASAQTITNAHYALLDSPPHKSNILAGDVSRVGIGVARFQPPYDKQLYITEVFADPVDDYPPSMVQSILETRVDELRQSGAGMMVSHPVLEEMASRSIHTLSVPYNREDLRSLAAASADELQENDRAELARMEVDVQLVRNPKKLSIPVAQREGQARMYGSAVRKITDDRNQTAFLVLTLIGITR